MEKKLGSFAGVWAFRKGDLNGLLRNPRPTDDWTIAGNGLPVIQAREDRTRILLNFIVAS